MNKVNIEIKRLLLNYPSIIKSRFDALSHLFLTNGNGYCWENGELRERFGEKNRNSDKMNYSDLAKQQSVLMDEELSETNQVLIERINVERTFRLLREINIELYTKRHVMNEDIRCGIDWLKHRDLKSCCLKDIPDDIHMDWALAAEEMLCIVRDSIIREPEVSFLDKENSSLIAMYHQSTQLLLKLNKKTGTNVTTVGK